MILALKALAYLVISFLLMALALFLAAGTIAWPAGWIYLSLLFGWLLVGIVLLLKYNPGLLEERLRLSQPNQKAWDRVFLLLFELFLFAWLVLMALDAVRFHWSQMPRVLQVVGAVTLVASFLLISLTFRENAFLSPTVRIQQERGQTVISTGPYHFVRHPMYAGGLLLFLGTPLLLGSWYGLVLVLILIPAGAMRAVLEERVLREELPGYATYMAQVKYRLIPFVW
jgi:protein-S-isoprenylcysteine O-methyltransferase Ste14